MGDGRTGAGDAVDFERGQHDARDVLLLCSDFERGRFGLLMHQICDVARGVRDLCERERSELHHPTHLPLRLFFFPSLVFLEVDGGGWTHFVDFTEDGAETRRQCVALFGEQRVAGLGALETGFGVRECHPRGENGFSWAGAGHGDR